MGLIPKPAPSLERSKMINAINEERYWRELKYQYAGMAMQGLLASKEQELLNTQELVEDAIIYATALVEKLKEEK